MTIASIFTTPSPDVPATGATREAQDGESEKEVTLVNETPANEGLQSMHNDPMTEPVI